MQPSLIIKINEKVFLKDPESTDLGKKIIEQSIMLIDSIGFERFNFKKLAEEIKSTEASIYRYFENKHKLLIYLLNWYWNWMEYKLLFQCNNIDDPNKKLQIAINLFAEPVEYDPSFVHINEVTLHRIIVSESPKAYLTKIIDEDNKEGYFRSFKRLCKILSDIIKKINPQYKYPTSLATTVIECCHNQKFFAEHLPSLTEVRIGDNASLSEFLFELVRTSIKDNGIASKERMIGSGF